MPSPVDSALTQADAVIADADDTAEAAFGCIVAGVRALQLIGGPIATAETLLTLARRVQAGAFGSGIETARLHPGGRA